MDAERLAEIERLTAERDALRAAGEALAEELAEWHLGQPWHVETKAALDRWRALGGGAAGAL